MDLLQFYENYCRDDLSSQRDIMNLYGQMRNVIQRWKECLPNTGLTHMNVSSRTFLHYPTEEGEEMVLLDLKYAGEGDMDWDLAAFAADLLYDEQQIFDLLVLYYAEALSEEEYMKSYEKMLLGTCIVSFVRGVQYRLLSKMVTDLRKKAFECLKYTKKILNILKRNHLI